MRSLLLALVLLAAIWPAISAADEFYYEISQGATPAVVLGLCNYVDHPLDGIPVPIQFTMRGYFVFDQPTSGVRFSLPDPDLTALTCPGAVQGDVFFEFPWSGDPHSAVNVDFGGCLTGTVHVFTLTISIVDDCALGGIFAPNDGSPGPLSLGCDAVERIVDDLSACTAPPTNLMPPDGATDVSINPTMTCSWTGPENCTEGIGLVIFNVYLGTDPDNLEFAGWQDYNEVVVGPLLPSTTYYWRMQVWDDFYVCPGTSTAWSPIMSFTTTAPLNTEERSWGSVKADYVETE